MRTCDSRFPGRSSTPARPATPAATRDRPRERGDDLASSGAEWVCPGPPPRARGRQVTGTRVTHRPGATPASTRTTPSGSTRVGRCWDHPRERGDDAMTLRSLADQPGPPPRARGRRGRPGAQGPGRGTTPASAGTTERDAYAEYLALGPPPRARGRHRGMRRRAAGLGTTPASAGTTSPPRARPRCTRDHPRERGDDGRGRAPTVASRGTTPASAGTTSGRRL